MDKLKIGLDVDDVLAAFYIAYALKHQKPLHPVDIWGEQWIIDKFKHDTLDINFWINLPVYNSPESIDFNVDCYISNIDPIYYNIRIDWLMMNGFPKAPLFLTSDKLSVIKERNLDYFVDDKIETIDLINNDKCKCKGIQFIPMYHIPKYTTDLFVNDLKHVNRKIKYDKSR